MRMMLIMAAIDQMMSIQFMSKAKAGWIETRSLLILTGDLI